MMSANQSMKMSGIPEKFNEVLEMQEMSGRFL
jgi:hypothetical protein